MYIIPKLNIKNINPIGMDIFFLIKRLLLFLFNSMLTFLAYLIELSKRLLIARLLVNDLVKESTPDSTITSPLTFSPIKNSSVIMVDHNLFGLKICSRALILEKGRIMEFSDIGEAVNFYTNVILSR